ncbi:hypothetical protein GUJ93_ZPchr0002g23606 [Zizania palustris]|uniref:Uncharacterized protein n=1 Tax=Zizania palustris TaxID=103762 RepID=A0A8J5SSC0_ZIZPA|nr:hypothetical protein GUJ93_ZPchr0002g23606 [Zizania palustris]
MRVAALGILHHLEASGGILPSASDSPPITFRGSHLLSLTLMVTQAWKALQATWKAEGLGVVKAWMDEALRSSLPRSSPKSPPTASLSDPKGVCDAYDPDVEILDGGEALRHQWAIFEALSANRHARFNVPRDNNGHVIPEVLHEVLDFVKEEEKGKRALSSSPETMDWSDVETDLGDPESEDQGLCSWAQLQEDQKAFYAQKKEEKKQKKKIVALAQRSLVSLSAERSHHEREASRPSKRVEAAKGAAWELAVEVGRLHALEAKIVGLRSQAAEVDGLRSQVAEIDALRAWATEVEELWFRVTEV